jgi:hypothetical protein
MVMIKELDEDTFTLLKELMDTIDFHYQNKNYKLSLDIIMKLIKKFKEDTEFIKLLKNLGDNVCNAIKCN